MTDSGQVRFDLTMTHHLAAVDYLTARSRRRMLRTVGGFLVSTLIVLGCLDLLFGGLSNGQLIEFVWLSTVFMLVGAVLVALLASRPVRRFLARRKGAVPCTLSFDQRELRVAFGKSAIVYPWPEVRAVDEDPEYVFVLASSGACFAVPKSAFGSPLHAEQFATALRRFLRL